MTVALITGASGFLARYLSTVLRAESGTRVVGADLAAPGPEHMLQEFVELDITRGESVSDFIRETRPDLIYHLAGVAGSDRERAFQVNTTGTVNVLEAARAHTPNAGVLVVGSAAEYGTAPLGSAPFKEDAQCSPRDPYGVSKLAATEAAQSFSRHYGGKIVVIRPFNIIGPGIRDSLLVGALARRAAKAVRNGEGRIRVGNLEGQRDFTAANDVAAGCVAALSRGRSGEIYNICSGRSTAVRWIADQIVSLSGRHLELEVDPALDRGADSSVGSPEKARRELGFEARRPLEDVLREIWNSVAEKGEACASPS